MARVVVAEDNKLVAAALKLALEAMGHVLVSNVETGPEAVQSALRNNPDLVILDGELAQGTSGIFAAAQIQELGFPVILASAVVDAAVARNAGAAAFLQKPFSFADLHRTIEDVLKAAAAHPKAQQKALAPV